MPRLFLKVNGIYSFQSKSAPRRAGEDEEGRVTVMPTGKAVDRVPWLLTALT